uniref:Cadherin domain-containing protein n=1 Tax=Ciona savignyi TaxID=51511 RepID=H2YNK7_CIOSA
TGELKTTRGIDRESLENDVIELLVVSSSSAPPVEITVEVLDVNDNHPIFKPPAHVDVNIPESTEAGAQYFLPTATDADNATNSVSTNYSIVGGPSDKFELLVDSSPGQETLLYLVTRAKFNRENQASYSLNISATDDGQPSLTGYLSISINIQDNNDNEPAFDFTEYSAYIPENATRGAKVLTVHATDLDEGANGMVRYTINRGSDVHRLFSVDPVSGVVTLVGQLDYEEKMVHELVVEVSDTTGSSGRCVVEVQLSGVNDNSPIFQPSSLTWLVPESAPLHSEIGRLRATDYDVGDINNEVTYALSPSNDPEIRRTFVVEASSGRIILTRSLDRETIGSYDVIVTSQDSDPVLPMTSTATCSVIIKDANDNRPRFVGSMEFHVTEGYYATATNIGAMATTDDDVGANGIVTYRIVGHGGGGEVEVGIDPNSGRLSVGGRLDREQFLPDGLFRITVVATDSATHPVDRMSAVGVVNIVVDDVNDRSPVFTSPDTFLLPTRMMDDARTVVASLHAADDDAGNNGDVIYSVTSSARFTLNPNSGSLLLSGDTPATGLLEQIDVTASDKG